MKQTPMTMSLRSLSRTLVSLAVAGVVAAAPMSLAADDDEAAAANAAADKELPSGAALLDYVETIKPAVVSVIATDADGVDVAAGSGFLVEDSFVVTNHQVVARGVSGRVVFLDSKKNVTYEAPITGVATHDVDVNLALVEIAFPEAPPAGLVKSLPVAEENAAKDLEVLLVTNPTGRSHSIALGTVHGQETRDNVDFPIMRIKVPRYTTGSTGGPFINGAGEAVGVAVMGLLDGQTQKFALPATALREFIASKDDTVPASMRDYHTSMASTLTSSEEAGEMEKIDPSELKLEATIVKQSDGSLLIDDKYVVKGAGTREDPYRVTWDLLVSAARVYQPREGLDKLPERITFLHDKWVKLSGFLAFPLMTNESDEVLLMLNQWDGCCVGVPPTPYDAIEVKLHEKIEFEGGINIFNYGSVTGVLKVDPYVLNKWLVGLYLMEDAHLALEM